MKRHWCIALIGLIAAPAYALNTRELVLQQEFDTVSAWYVSASSATGEDAEFGDVPASVCFATDTTKTCQKLESAGREMRYPLQTVRDLSITQNPHLVKLVARYASGASGELTQLRFWRYDRARDRFVPAGVVTLSEQGEYRLTEDGILITVDAAFGPHETRFARHRFVITAYRYHPARGFMQALRYTTRTPYPSLDEVDEIDVISREMHEIRHRLMLQRAH